MPPALARYLACLPVGLALAACTETRTPIAVGSESSAPPSLANRDLQPPAAPNPGDPIADTGVVQTSTTAAANAGTPGSSPDSPPGSAPAAGSAPESSADGELSAAEPPETTAPSAGGEGGSVETVSEGSDEAGAPPDSSEPNDGRAPDYEKGEELNFPTPVTPSAGCSEANPEPAQGLASLLIRGVAADYLVTLPDGYDGSAPVPLIFGFHGRARSYLDFVSVDATEIQSELGSRAIMVYPQAQGGEGWTNEPELAPSLEFFDALYPQLLANYCVDRSHVFAVGHSSGGFFAHILACRYGERLRGIGVVAGTLLERECSGYVAAVMIHGVRDSVVDPSRGVAARDFLRTRNGCRPDTLPGPDGPCVTYQGCEPGLPIAWCEHDEPTYDDTNHGWPSFASHTIADFFFSLP